MSDFAVKKGIEDKLIASNDIHIGKTNPTETDYLRRNVAKFQRFNTYEPDEDWERELYIKTNETLKEVIPRSLKRERLTGSSLLPQALA